jgi:hypothetical protein
MEWKTHIEKIIPKMSSICYALRFVYHFSVQTYLKWFVLLASIQQINMELYSGLTLEIAEESFSYKRKLGML